MRPLTARLLAVTATTITLAGSALLAVSAEASLSLGSGDALSINQLRDVRPNEVEQTENEG